MTIRAWEAIPLIGGDAVGTIATLASLMAFTAGVDWNASFVSRRKRAKTTLPNPTAPIATPPPIQ